MSIEVNFESKTQKMVLENFDEKDWITVQEKTFQDRGMAHKMLFEIQRALPEGAWIAGGCFERAIHGEPIKDIDIFFRDEETFMKAFDSLTAVEKIEKLDLDVPFEEDVNTNEGKNWYSNLVEKDPEEMEGIIGSSKTRFIVLTKKNRPDIQLIKTMWYPSAEAVLHGFDFTAAQIATKTVNGHVEVTMNPMALSDIQRKRLILWRMTFPTSTIRRMIKYAQKGYYACGGALETLATAVRDQMTDHPDTKDIQYID